MATPDVKPKEEEELLKITMENNTWDMIRATYKTRTSSLYAMISAFCVFVTIRLSCFIVSRLSIISWQYYDILL